VSTRRNDNTPGGDTAVPSDHADLLEGTRALAARYLARLPARPVAGAVDRHALRRALGGALPQNGENALDVVEALVRDAAPGLVASSGPRYFGFVTGGTLPAALAADWLTAAWDQNAGLNVMSPAASVVEEIAAAWLVELFGLPAAVSTGFTTGATMANFTGLAAARHALLARAGWNVEADGLFGAPSIHVIAGAEAHASVFAALQMLGLGRERVTQVPADGQGRMCPEALAEILSRDGRPALVCAQAGNVNTGAFDPLEPIAETAHAHGAWLHVDGAFGLWAALSPELRHHLGGVERADSWATDAHKWLNVPYDSGIVFVAHPEAHRAAVTAAAPYLIAAQKGERDPDDWVPEASRRARGFAVYAALRSLGRAGLAQLVERCCRLARRMAQGLASEPGVDVLNEVVLNQVLVRFHSPGPGAHTTRDDELTQRVIQGVQDEGTCWLGGTRWREAVAMRISVCNWSTTEDDVDRSVEAIVRCVRALRHG
jgi:glutamate/tyrosine decarboxylase-like PLP-dependent enzyme